MTNWTQPTCERCWILRRSTSDAEGRIEGVEIPYRLKEPSLEQCAFCGEPTIFGVYVRINPASVMFPAQEEAPVG